LYELAATVIPGCTEIRPRIHIDARGRFVKLYHQAAFEEAGLRTDYAETNYSTSRRGVLRGLHFQVPPRQHAKLVCCVQGRIQDAVVDLRVGSPTYRQYVLVELSAEDANMLFIPAGLAHGFCVLSESATVAYQVTSVYSPAHDAGILWSSAGIPWQEANPILAERDRHHPGMDDYASPFVFEACE
jgi:dTDP-4-dehydrorhamnose 3,5-epimerase